MGFTADVEEIEGPLLLCGQLLNPPGSFLVGNRCGTHLEVSNTSHPKITELKSKNLKIW